MPPDSYLQRLTTFLTEGLARRPPTFRARHADYLRHLQNPDGGFPDRQGGSDLYYTAFALRGLAVLDALAPDVCTKAAGFLRESLTRQTSAVDFYSLLYACLLVQAGGGPDVLADSPPDWPARVAATLETLRTPDGGYGKVPGSASGSTYHTFLVGLTYELLGRTFQQPADVVRFVHGRRRDDGGFVELAPMRRSGTNPTAAAVGALQLVGEGDNAPALTPEIRAGVIDFLTGMASPAEGGLQANGRAPLADLLSTFTGAWTLRQLDALERLDLAGVQAYAESLEEDDGGFRGGLWDEGTDAEYTFYGLGLVALLTA